MHRSERKHEIWKFKSVKVKPHTAQADNRKIKNPNKSSQLLYENIHEIHYVKASYKFSKYIRNWFVK